MSSWILEHIRKGNKTYDLKDAENEARFDDGILKKANGGTGLNASPSMMTNLASTSADDVLKAEPRPGVTGTLGIANGGTGATSAKNAILALGIYPVGAIYMSVNSTDPGTLFGGTWERLKDRFLLCAGDTYAAAATGGAASTSYTPESSNGNVGATTLTNLQCALVSHVHGYEIGLPNHTHSFTPPSISVSAKYSKSAQSGSSANRVDSSGSNSTNAPYTASAIGGSVGGVQSPYPIMTGNTASTGLANAPQSHTHSFTGKSKNIATMPPYLAVYVWKRTA